jgi:hypothetical protein
MSVPASSRFINTQTAGGTATGLLSYLGALNATPSPGRRFIRLSNITAVTSALGVATVTFPARAIDSVTATVVNTATTVTLGFGSISSIGTTPVGAIPVSVVTGGVTAVPAFAFAAYNVNIQAFYH